MLLGLLGAALLYAACEAKLRLPVIVAALISKLSFVFLAFRAPAATREILRVAYIDVAAIMLLAFSTFVFWRSRHQEIHK